MFLSRNRKYEDPSMQNLEMRLPGRGNRYVKVLWREYLGLLKNRKRMWVEQSE